MKSIFALLPALLLPLLAAIPACATAPGADASKELQVYILLDRTGSMESIWDEALNSVNAYADELTKEQTPPLDVEISLAVFDAQEGLQFDMLRRKATPESWTPVTSEEASPRGMTPLFDAIGAMLTVAEEDKPEKAVIVVMTDGLENASREMTKETVKARLDKAREKGWEVVFLGAEFGNFDDAASVGVSAAKRMGVSKDGMEETMRRLSKKSRDYGVAQDAAPIEFDDSDREAAGEEDVKNKQ
ncbi:MAG: vWA domain-containing protein [Amphiplicatus sp.]